eukprot:scaffold103408_cov127-Cyclotella_meneghiniana.AAC.1
MIKVTSEDKSFEFDAVFNEKSSEKEVYWGTGGDTIKTFIYKGFNGTILAYGQTGSDYEVKTKKFANHNQLLTAISTLARFFAEMNDRQSTSTNNVTMELRRQSCQDGSTMMELSMRSGMANCQPCLF